MASTISDAGSWFRVPSAAYVGVGGVECRRRRVLNCSFAAFSTGGYHSSSCSVGEFPWFDRGNPSINTWTNPRYVWYYPSGPGLQAVLANSSDAGSSSEGIFVERAAEVSAVLLPLHMTTAVALLAAKCNNSTVPLSTYSADEVIPSVSLPVFGAALATPQLKPAHLGYSQSPLSLPTRAAEPWSIENWFVPTSIGTSATLFMQGAYMYATTPSLASGGHRDGFSVVSEYYQARLGHIGAETYPWTSYIDVCVQVIAAVCPRFIYSPANTPWNTSIKGNDVCRQLTVWPPKQRWPASHQYSTSRYEQPQYSTCPTWHGPNIDSYMDEQVAHEPLRLKPVEVCSSGTIDLRQRDQLIAYRAPTRWHQSLMTMYPPGTVAVLPITPGTPIVGDSPDYHWRVNRAHVVAFSVDVPASDILGESVNHTTTSRPGSAGRNDAVCSAILPRNRTVPQVKLPGIRVLLDDPWCVEGRNCTPDVGMASWNSTPSIMQLLEKYSRSNAAGGLFPRARLGCAVAYDIDHTLWNVDLMPDDLPAQQNTQGFAVGGLQRPYRGLFSAGGGVQLARNGRYPVPPGTPPNVTYNYTGGVHPASLLGSRENTYPSPDYGAPAFMPGIAGPLAVYRGAVPSRIFPLHPNSSLPRIQGGSWSCHRSSLQGNFAGRPVCVATCNDPTYLPVDVGLEQLPGGVWQQVASVVRLWYGEWRGHPSLRQSDELLQLDRLSMTPAVAPLVPEASAFGPGSQPQYMSGTTPKMVCRADRPAPGMFWKGYRTDQAYRSRTSVARLSFDLYFDRNSWPAALTQTFYLGPGPPGLDYPHPVQSQLEWMLNDLLDDLRDLAGDEVETRGWKASVTRVATHDGDQVQPRSGFPAIAQMFMRISIVAYIPPRRLLDSDTGEGNTDSQRDQSAGAVVQRLVATLRGERPGSTGGTWLLAVDPESVSYSVQLPCLRAMGYARAERCEEEWSILLGRSVMWPQLLLVGLSAMAILTSLFGSFDARDLQAAGTSNSSSGRGEPYPQSIHLDDLATAGTQSNWEDHSSTNDVWRDSGSTTETGPAGSNGSIPLWHDLSGASVSTARVAWLWALVVTLVYAECSLPALVLGLGLAMLCLVRMGMLLGCGVDLLGTATSIRAAQAGSTGVLDLGSSDVGIASGSPYAGACVEPACGCCRSFIGSCSVCGCLKCACLWHSMLPHDMGETVAYAGTFRMAARSNLRRSGRRADGTEDAWAPPVKEERPTQADSPMGPSALVNKRRTHWAETHMLSSAASSQTTTRRGKTRDGPQDRRVEMLKLQSTAAKLAKRSSVTHNGTITSSHGTTNWSEGEAPALEDPAASLDASHSSINTEQFSGSADDQPQGLLAPWMERKIAVERAEAEAVNILTSKASDNRGHDSQDDDSSRADQAESLQFRLRYSASSEDQAVVGLARMQALQPALYSAIRGLSVLTWDAQSVAAWLAFREDLEAARHVHRQPLLQGGSQGGGADGSKSPYQLAWRALQLRLGVVRRHSWWLLGLEHVLVLGVLVWVVLCIVGVCGWQECSLMAAQLAAGRSDADLLRSALQESEGAAVFALEPVLVGLQRLQLLSVSVPMVVLHTGLSWLLI